MSNQKFRIQIDPQALVPRMVVRKYYFLGAGIVLLMGTVLGLAYQRLPRVVPLYFTEPWGEARLAPKVQLAMLPLLALLVLVVNVLVTRAVHSEHKALVHTLAVGALAVTLMFAVALFGIVQSLL